MSQKFDELAKLLRETQQDYDRVVALGAALAEAFEWAFGTQAELQTYEGKYRLVWTKVSIFRSWHGPWATSMYSAIMDAKPVWETEVQPWKEQAKL